MSDCLRLLNCFLFHSTQNIAVCLVPYIQLIDTAPVCIVGSVTIGGASCVKVLRELRAFLFSSNNKTHSLVANVNPIAHLTSVLALQHNSALKCPHYAPPPVPIHTLALPSLNLQHFSL